MITMPDNSSPPPLTQADTDNTLNSNVATIGEDVSEMEDIEEVVPPLYRVLISGAVEVGKTTLQHQFMTSEYLGNADNIPGG